MSPIERLQRWYESMCNGDWEHSYGVNIESIDNPGWLLRVELRDSYLADVPFVEICTERQNPRDWLTCKVENQEFVGTGGASNLDELLTLFLDWAESATQ